MNLNRIKKRPIPSGLSVILRDVNSSDMFGGFVYFPQPQVWRRVRECVCVCATITFGMAHWFYCVYHCGLWILRSTKSVPAVYVSQRIAARSRKCLLLNGATFSFAIYTSSKGITTGGLGVVWGVVFAHNMRMSSTAWLPCTENHALEYYWQTYYDGNRNNKPLRLSECDGNRI